jgi:AcrR family transcriptional regulator
MASRATLRQEQARQTRDSLLSTGLEIAERVGLAGMSVNRIVEEAGVAKGTFFHHFPDRSAFLASLYDEFHGGLHAAVASVIDGIEPGAEHLIIAANAYLDECLGHRGVRALLLEAHADAQVSQTAAENDELASQRISKDFVAMGWDHPLDAARLWRSLVVEAALLELRSSRRRPALRAVLGRFLDQSVV